MKLITDPDKFFEELKRKEIKIRKPMVIVIVLGLVMSVYQYFLINKLSQAFPSEIARYFIVSTYIGIIGSFIGVFATWLIIAVIMHGLSSFFNGKGSFRRTFEFTGYGFLPSLIGSAIIVSMSLYYMFQAEIPKISIEQIQQNPDIMNEIMLSLIPKDLVYSSLVINLAVTVWSLVIWSFAIKHAREIEFKKAFICALIPTVILGIYQLWSILEII